MSATYPRLYTTPGYSWQPRMSRASADATSASILSYWAEGPKCSPGAMRAAGYKSSRGADRAGASGSLRSSAILQPLKARRPKARLIEALQAIREYFIDSLALTQAELRALSESDRQQLATEAAAALGYDGLL